MRRTLRLLALVWLVACSKTDPSSTDEDRFALLHERYGLLRPEHLEARRLLDGAGVIYTSTPVSGGKPIDVGPRAFVLHIHPDCVWTTALLLRSYWGFSKSAADDSRVRFLRKYGALDRA